MQPLAVANPAPPVAASTIEALASALEAALSPNTRRAYSTAWRGFAEYAERHGQPSAPATPELVAAYLAHRHAEGASTATLRMASAAIAKAHAVAGQANPCASPIVRAALSGMAKQQAANGRRTRQAKPLDAEAVAAIRGAFNGRADSNPRIARNMALVSTLASAALRRSEASALVWGDLDLEAGTLIVRRSKTDATGQGAVVALSDGAVRDLRRLRTMRGEFHAHQSVFKLGPEAVANVVAACAKAAGLGDGYSGHSGRVGCAVTMTRAGAPAATTMRQARWSSSAMLARYTAALTALCRLR